MTQDQWTRAAGEHVNGVGLFETPWTTATDAFPLPQIPAARRSRRGLVITVGVLVVLAVVGLVIVLGGSASSRTATPPGAGAVVTPVSGPTEPLLAPSAAAPAVPAAAASATAAATGPVAAAQNLFVDDVRNAPGLSGMSRVDILAAGNQLCAAIPTVPSRAALTGLLAQAKFDPHVVDVFLTAAVKDLCPQATYGQRS